MSGTNKIDVSGLSGNNEETLSPVQSEEQQNIPTANLSGTNDTDGNNEETLSPAQSEEQQNIPTANLSGTNNIDGNNNELLVSISPLKNPVARGDSQNTTITVTDSASRAVANAEIDGNLIYPGDNFEKEFTGITDSQGKFVYSWIIGENGDVGPLSIEVEVSSQGYPPSSATGSFDIVDSSAESGINKASTDSFDNKITAFDYVIAGDYTCDSMTRQTVENMEEKDPDLVFALGDLSEVKDPQCFFDIMSELNVDGKFKITLGEYFNV